MKGLHSLIGGTYGIGNLRFIRNAALVFAILYLGLLYADLIARGVIPLFSCMERYEYVKIAGPLHAPLFIYGQIYLMFLGGLTIADRIRGGRYDWRFLFVLLGAVFYAIATGNRFSAPVAMTYFYSMPMAALFVVWGVSKDRPIGQTWLSMAKSRVAEVWPLLTVYGAILLMVVGALYSSYALLRSNACRGTVVERSAPFAVEATNPSGPVTTAITGDATSPPTSVSSPPLASETRIVTNKPDVALAQSRFLDRLLVQPAELWASTIDRVVRDGDYQPGKTFHYLFTEPGLKGGDVGVRYVMARAVGFDREHELERNSVQFQGGYPDIFFEMFGYWGFLPAVAVAAALMSSILYFFLRCLVTGRILAFGMMAYIFFSMFSLYSSGTPLFVISWTFYAKLLALLAILAIENRFLLKRSAPGIPPHPTIPDGSSAAAHSSD